MKLPGLSGVRARQSTLCGGFWLLRLTKTSVPSRSRSPRAPKAFTVLTRARRNLARRFLWLGRDRPTLSPHARARTPRQMPSTYLGNEGAGSFIIQVQIGSEQVRRDTSTPGFIFRAN